jgi:hypothetical protein
VCARTFGQDDGKTLVFLIFQEHAPFNLPVQVPHQNTLDRAKSAFFLRTFGTRDISIRKISQRSRIRRVFLGGFFHDVSDVAQSGRQNHKKKSRG